MLGFNTFTMRRVLMGIEDDAQGVSSTLFEMTFELEGATEPLEEPM
jgi:hypothetical protein